MQTLSPDFFSTGIKQVVYCRDKYLIHSGDCMQKQRVCLLLLVLLDIYVEVINMSVIYTWNKSHGSSGSIVSDYGLDNRGSIPDRGRGFFF
jgi:hypothetical protein